MLNWLQELFWQIFQLEIFLSTCWNSETLWSCSEGNRGGKHVFIKARVQSNSKNSLNQPVSNTQSSSPQGVFIFFLSWNWTRQASGVCLQSSCSEPVGTDSPPVPLIPCCSNCVSSQRVTLCAQREKCPLHELRYPESCVSASSVLHCPDVPWFKVQLHFGGLEVVLLLFFSESSWLSNCGSGLFSKLRL